MKPKLMEEDKRRIVNALAEVILSDFEKIDKRSASQLRSLLKAGKVYFVLNPKTDVLKRELIRTKYGETVSETHGLTTTYYLKGSGQPLVSFITLPEERLFGRKKGRLFLKLRGVETLVHEMSHLLYPEEKAEQVVERLLGRKWARLKPEARRKLAAETIADVFTVDFLLKHGRTKEAREYLSGRTFTRSVRKKLVENALKQARKKQKEEYAARWRQFMARARESKVRPPKLLPGKTEIKKKKAGAGVLKKLLRH